MPCLIIHTNTKIDDTNKTEVVNGLSHLISTLTHKPQTYVMVVLHDNLPMLMSGSSDPCCYIELKSLDLPEDQTADYSRELCDFIENNLAISAARIYIEFSNAERHMWGWNRTTF